MPPSPLPIKPMNNEHPGIGRLAYTGALFGTIVLCTVLHKVNTNAEIAGIIAILGIAGSAVLTILRLQNIGWSGWWFLIGLIPIAGMLVNIPCLTFPPGYRTRKKLDTPGQVILAIIIATFIIIGLACGIASLK
jgi:uncharacterized membrane protein YhaH (DUF805 family)